MSKFFRRIFSLLLVLILFNLPAYILCSNNLHILESTAHAANASPWIGEPRQIEYQYDNQSRVVATSDGVRFSYDEAGRVTVRQTSQEQQNFVWDSQGRLVEVRFSDGTQTTYQYDPLGRMAQRTNRAGETTKFVYDELRLIQERRNNESVIASYIYTKELDNPVLMAKDGKTYLFVYDRLGSAVALVDVTSGSNNDVVARYRYDAWGNILTKTEDISQPFRFAGYIWEPDAELYYLKNRWYDPSIGRFLSPDPLLPVSLNPQEWNAYAYAANDPVNRIDSMGLRSELNLSRGYTPWNTLKRELNQLPDILVRNVQKQSGNLTEPNPQSSANQGSWMGLPSASQTSLIDGWGTSNPEAANIMLNPTLGKLPDITQGFTTRRLLALAGLGELPQQIGNVIAYAHQLAFPQVFGDPWFSKLLHADSPFTPELVNRDYTSTQLRSLFGYSNDITDIPYLYTNGDFKRPSGIPLEESAKALAELTDITGAVWDEKNNQLIITGVKGNGPGLKLDDLIVAIEALSAGKEIGVSIDPMPQKQGEPQPDQMGVRYIPEEIQGTNLGRVLFEADRQLKVLSLGYDQVTGKPAPAIKGYQSEVDLIDSEYVEKGEAVWNRMWFEPEPLSIKTAPGIFRYDQAKLKLHTEYFDPGPPSKSMNGSDPIAEKFISNLNSNYDSYAAKIPVFQELEQALKLVGVAKWLRSESVPIDSAWLRDRRPPAPTATPTTTPARTFYSDSLVERDEAWYRLGLYGGVSFAAEATRTPADELNALRERNLNRPSDASVTWKAPSGEINVAISLGMKDRVGGVRANAVDFSMVGDSMFSLVRHFGSLRPAQAGSLKEGWFIEPCSLEFPDVMTPPLEEGGEKWQKKIIFRDHRNNSSVLFNLVHNSNQANTLGYWSAESKMTFEKIEKKKYKATMGNQSYEFDLQGKLQKVSLNVSSVDSVKEAVYLRKDDILSEIQYLDSQGRLIDKILFTYDSSNRLIETKNQAGQIKRYEYKGNCVSQIKDGQNVVLAKYTCNNYGRVTQIQGPGGEILFQAKYDVYGRANQFMLEGVPFTLSYSASGDIVQLERDGKLIGKITFDSESGRLVKLEGLEGLISSLDSNEKDPVDAKDNVVRIKLADSSAFLAVRMSPSGSINHVEHSAAGTLLDVIRDIDDRPLSVTTHPGMTTNIEYDALKQIRRITTAYEGHAIEFTSDGKGGWSIQDPDGVILRIHPEGSSSINASHMGNNQPVTIRNDLAGKFIELATSLKEKFRLYQDAQDNLSKLETPFGQFQVEQSGQFVVTVKKDESQEYRYTFNKFGKLVQVQDSQGSKLELQHDLKKNATRILRPDGTIDEIYRDRSNRIIEISNSQSEKIKIQRDQFGRIVQIESTSSKYPLQLAYDDLSRLNRLRQGSDLDIEIVYSSKNRSILIKNQDSQIFIGRDLDGRITVIRDTDGRETHYLYSQGGRVTRIAYPPAFELVGAISQWITKQPGGLQVFYNYDTNGRTKSIALGKPDQIVAEFFYDADDRVTQIKSSGFTINRNYASGYLTSRIKVISATGEVVYDVTYEYDPQGRCIRESSLQGTRTFIYDKAEKLVETKYSDGYKQHIDYDAGGNRKLLRLLGIDPTITKDVLDPTEPLQAQREQPSSERPS